MKSRPCQPRHACISDANVSTALYEVDEGVNGGDNGVRMVQTGSRLPYIDHPPSYDEKQLARLKVVGTRSAHELVEDYWNNNSSITTNNSQSKNYSYYGVPDHPNRSPMPESSKNNDRNGNSSDPFTLIGFGASLFLYFCIVVYLARRGGGAFKREIDYCMVRKEVQPHHEAHTFNRDDDATDGTYCHCSCCICCPSFKKTNSMDNVAAVPPTSSPITNPAVNAPSQKGTPTYDTSRGNASDKIEQEAYIIGDIQSSLQPHLPDSQTKSFSSPLISSPMSFLPDLYSASVVLARYRSRNEDIIESDPGALELSKCDEDERKEKSVEPSIPLAILGGLRVDIGDSDKNDKKGVICGLCNTSNEHGSFEELGFSLAEDMACNESALAGIKGLSTDDQLATIGTASYASHTIEYDGTIQPQHLDDESTHDVKNEPLACPICLNAYEIKDIVSWSRLQSCHHVFHYECILPWALLGNFHCPVCREAFWSRNAKIAVKKSRIAAIANSEEYYVSHDGRGIGRSDDFGVKLDDLEEEEVTHYDVENGLEEDSVIATGLHSPNSSDYSTGANITRPRVLLPKRLRVHPHQKQKQKQHQVVRKFRQTKIERSKFCVVHGLVPPSY